MQNKEIILKIIHTKNNTFFTFLDLNHNLLYKQSLGTKITQDFKATLLSKVTIGLTKIIDLNQIEESPVTINLYLYLNNFPKVYVSDLLTLFIL